MIPVRLPHLMEESDFDGQSLCDWIETWLGGFEDNIVDGAYRRAEDMAKEFLGVTESDGCLRDIECDLTSKHKLLIWRDVFALDAV